MSYVVNQTVIQLTKWLFCLLVCQPSCELLGELTAPACHEWNSQQHKSHHGFPFSPLFLLEQSPMLVLTCPQSSGAGRTLPLPGVQEICPTHVSGLKHDLF